MSLNKWNRKDFPDNSHLQNDPRKWAESETNNDLQKPPQQLLCDTIEETLIAQFKNDRVENEDSEEVRMLRCLLGATRRLTSLQTVNALSSSKTNNWLMWLTIVIVLQTSWLIYIAYHPVIPLASLPPTKSVTDGPDNQHPDNQEPHVD